jgi:glutamate carboxypeptidase
MANVPHAPRSAPSPASSAPQAASGFTDALCALVEAESPSEDWVALAQAQDVLAEVGRDLLGTGPTRMGPDGEPVALTWHRGDPADPARVLILGHIDTVWPRGTLAARPFEVRAGRAYGPGVFDMKAGLVAGLHALSGLGPDLPVSLMVTADEEVGSWASREAILKEAARAQAVLVLEGAGPEGAVKSARKGWSIYRLGFHGVAAHAGLEPEKGRNALVRLAGLVHELCALDGRAPGRSVTPTTAVAGTTVNTVPDTAELAVDVRTADAADQQEVDRLLTALAGTYADGVEVRVGGGINRPPMERAAAVPLLERLQHLKASDQPVIDVAVGGISDANLTAAAGIPTLDGLGAVGGGAHADDEWVDLDATRQRVPLLDTLVRDLISDPLGAPTPGHRP